MSQYALRDLLVEFSSIDYCSDRSGEDDSHSTSNHQLLLSFIPDDFVLFIATAIPAAMTMMLLQSS